MGRTTCPPHAKTARNNGGQKRTSGRPGRSDGVGLTARHPPADTLRASHQPDWAVEPPDSRALTGFPPPPARRCQVFRRLCPLPSKWRFICWTAPPPASVAATTQPDRVPVDPRIPVVCSRRLL